MENKKTLYENIYQKDMMTVSDKYATFIKQMKGYMPVNRFLDIGCGDGSFMDAVKRDLGAGDVYGCDISSEAINAAEHRNAGKCYEVDIDKGPLPFQDGFFDLVMCGEIIEHLYDPEHLLEELYRVSSDKGVIFLTTPNLGSWFNRLSVLCGYMPIFSDTGLRYIIVAICGRWTPRDICAFTHTPRSRNWLKSINFL